MLKKEKMAFFCVYTDEENDSELHVLLQNKNLSYYMPIVDKKDFNELVGDENLFKQIDFIKEDFTASESIILGTMNQDEGETEVVIYYVKVLDNNLGDLKQDGFEFVPLGKILNGIPRDHRFQDSILLASTLFFSLSVSEAEITIE